MKFSVCVDAVFMHHDFYESIERLGQKGYKNIEFWGWEQRDLDRLLKLKEKYDLNFVDFCACEFNMTDPKQMDAYEDGIRRSCEAAKKLGTKLLLTKPNDMNDLPYEKQYETMVENLRRAANVAAEFGVTILLEPVNSRYEAPNTFLPNSDLGFKAVEDVNDPHVKLIYDLYHMQIDEGDVLHRLLPKLSEVKHIHTAGSNDRHELWDGELNYRYVLNEIEKAGYDGYIGLEHFSMYEDPMEGIDAIIRDGRLN